MDEQGKRQVDKLLRAARAAEVDLKAALVAERDADRAKLEAFYTDAFSRFRTPTSEDTSMNDLDKLIKKVDDVASQAKTLNAFVEGIMHRLEAVEKAKSQGITGEQAEDIVWAAKAVQEGNARRLAEANAAVKAGHVAELIRQLESDEAAELIAQLQGEAEQEWLERDQADANDAKRKRLEAYLDDLAAIEEEIEDFEAGMDALESIGVTGQDAADVVDFLLSEGWEPRIIDEVE